MSFVQNLQHMTRFLKCNLIKIRSFMLSCFVMSLQGSVKDLILIRLFDMVLYKNT